MAGKCKACHSPLRGEIDDRLRHGDSCETVATWCNTNGLVLSAQSIYRHRDSHLEHYTPPAKPVKKEVYDEMPSLVNIDAYLKKFISEHIDTDVFKKACKERKTTQLLLEKLLQNQLVIVIQLQTDYTTSQGSYPEAQIRGLKTLFDMVSSLPTYNDASIRHGFKENNRLLEQHYLNASLNIEDDYDTGFDYEDEPV